MFLVFSKDVSNRKEFYNNFNPSDSLVAFKVEKVLKNNIYYKKYIGSVVKVGNVKTYGNVLLNLQKDSVLEAVKIGDYLYFKTDFLTIDKPKNPYQFNYKSYLEKQGVQHQVFLTNTKYLHKESSQNSIYKIAEGVRSRIEEKLQLNGFKGEELAVIKALILGQRNTISKELLQEYTKAGAIHILAVSGLHVGIILLILTSLFKPLEKLKNGKVIKTILIVLLLWGFAVIAGLSASVVRAVTMFTAVAIGMTFERKTFVLHSLITSMFVLLLIKPLFLFDVGFQLSYLAVFSIVAIQPMLSNLWNPKLKITTKIWQLFTVSLAAQIGVLPISLFYFHQFPGLFMLSNLVIIPFIGVILMGGILIIVLALFNVLPSFLASIYSWVISVMNDFVGWISFQESFLIKDISFSFGLLITSYLIFFFGIHYFEKKSFRKLLFLIVSVISLQLCSFYEKQKVATTDQLVIFNKSRQTVIGQNTQGKLLVYHSLDTVSIRNLGMIKDYKLGAEVVGVEYLNKIPNVLKFKNELLVVVDSLGIYKIGKLKNPTILLSYSPSINLERLINQLEPKQIVADASSYKSKVLHWQMICDKKKIPFWFTGDKGAYIFK
jgi:competence protein ComEC